MNEQTKKIALAGGLTLVVIAAGYSLFFRGEDNSPPKGDGKSIYYTGPMKSKGGGGGYGTVDGKGMTDAEGKAAADKWLKEHPELNVSASSTNGQPASDATNQVN